ncbi:hypothetical protein HRbin36_02580 [bacterium HR36]|nr:hypothetical protein HRbin36_02580 [bacterium HR36]
MVGDEIRAALARRIVSGTAPQRAHAPTLFDLWQAYRELGTSLPQVAWITLDVNEERFVRSVPEPTDQELQSFFEKYKQQEPDPLRAEPGFRVPTRYRVEFIYADVRYDAKDPARTGEAWPHYRQLAEAGWGLAPLLGLTPALSSAGPFLPALATHGLSLKVPAYERYLALRDSRFRLNEPRASYARTGTPWGQRIHHHGLLPPGSGPWYRPGAAEMEQATQAVLQTISALANLPAVSNPAVAMSRPITVRAPYAECLALDLAGSLAHHLGLTVALAAPVVAGPEPGSFWPTAQVTTVAAACLVGQLAGPGIPTWTDPLWRETYRPLQNVPILRLAPVGEGLALAWWMPTHYVPFTDVANELELDFLRSQVTRLLDGDLQRLQKDLSEYQKLYEKAYREWRKLQRKLGTERFTPPPFGPNKEPLQAYLERFCQARGLRYFPMPQPRNRFELMPRASGELGKILYPLYVEAFAPPPATHPLEAFREELEFADTLIQGRRLLMDLQSQQDKAEPTQEQYGLYQGRYLIPKGMPQHRALIWKAEESPGYVPRFEEVREQVRQAWTKQKARELAQKHAEELAERIRQLHQQRQSSLEDVLRELRGDPNFPELDKMQTVELRRFQYQVVSRPVTGLEKSLPGPAFRAIRYPPVVDYPERDFLQQALDHLRQSGDTWITTNQPGDKVHLLVLVNEPRFPTPTEFAMDYLRRPTDSRIRVEDASGSDESLEEWVSRRRQRQYREQFLQFLRQRYGLDDEKWRQLQDHTRRYLGS